MFTTHRFIILSMAVCLMAGCAQDYALKMQSVVQAHHDGQPDAAIAAYDEIYSSKDPEKLDMLYYAERGELLRARADGLADSTQAWRQADGKVVLWEDSVRSALTRSLDGLDQAIFNNAFSDYQGQDYEKVQLNTRLAENYLLQGQWTEGRIAIRRMYERETLIKEVREREVEALKESAERQGIDYGRLSLEDIQNYPVQIFNDPQVIQLRNAYQSAASHYLAGFVFEALQERGLAAAGYRNAIELRPDVPLLRQALADLGKQNKNKKGSTPQTDVLFMIETGAISPRRTIKTLTRLPFYGGLGNIIVAYPVIRPADAGDVPEQFSVNGQKVPVALVTSLDAMARRTLRDEMPGIVLRNAISAGVQAAAHVAADNTINHNDNAGVVAAAIIGQIGVMIAANLYADANSDTRQWQTLPAYISLARARLGSGDYSVALSTPNGSYQQTVHVDGPYALVVLHLSGNGMSAMSSSPRSVAQVSNPSPTAATPTLAKQNVFE